PGIRRPVGPVSAWARDHWWQVPFSGPPAHVARWSYVDVLEGRVPAGALQGKVVLVGATAVGMGDAYPTPMASQDALMPGVEISANVLDALQRGLSLRRAEPWENALASACMMALALAALRWLQPRTALVSIGLLMPAVLFAAWLAQRHAGVQFAPLTGLLALALAYPLWSWRRLEAAMRYLAQEFDRTQRAAPEAASAEGTSGKPVIRAPGTVGNRRAYKQKTGDALDHRMRAMAEAAERLRALQREQQEAWRFISHDMRAPQASILTLIEGQRSQGPVDADTASWLDRIEGHARRTLALAEDYVHLARVRSGGVRGQVALNDVLFDAVDQQWALAGARHVRLPSEVPEALCMAHADGLLLTRALVNLIDNAIKFSPPHGAVQCTLVCHEGRAVFTVSDEGPGLAPEAQAALFRPFGVASATSPAYLPDSLSPATVVHGAGLGLSFVRSVADCHGGQVGVHSTPGQGAAFWLSLPILAATSPADADLTG
ncbi:MAG: CHASE2 domain-containing protein, partial [Rubrivivax sp.]